MMVGQLEKRGLMRVDDETQADSSFLTPALFETWLSVRSWVKLAKFAAATSSDRYWGHGMHGDG